MEERKEALQRKKDSGDIGVDEWESRGQIRRGERKGKVKRGRRGAEEEIERRGGDRRRVTCIFISCFTDIEPVLVSLLSLSLCFCPDEKMK